jgi:hypothetical protein
LTCIQRYAKHLQIIRLIQRVHSVQKKWRIYVRPIATQASLPGLNPITSVPALRLLLGNPLHHLITPALNPPNTPHVPRRHTSFLSRPRGSLCPPTDYHDCCAGKRASNDAPAACRHYRQDLMPKTPLALSGGQAHTRVVVKGWHCKPARCRAAAWRLKLEGPRLTLTSSLATFTTSATTKVHVKVGKAHHVLPTRLPRAPLRKRSRTPHIHIHYLTRNTPPRPP